MSKFKFSALFNLLIYHSENFSIEIQGNIFIKISLYLPFQLRLCVQNEWPIFSAIANYIYCMNVTFRAENIILPNLIVFVKVFNSFYQSYALN